MATTNALELTNWYMRMLTPLNNEIKLSLIHQLSASLLATRKIKAKTDFFSGLNNSWDDGVSPEEETNAIRHARRSNITRKTETLTQKPDQAITTIK